MVDPDAQAVNNNVTHRLFTHRLWATNIGRDAARHPTPIWPRNPPRAWGARDQSGRGCGEVRTASDILQRRRARDQERVAGEYREDCERPAEEFAGPVWSRLSGVNLDVVGRFAERVLSRSFKALMCRAVYIGLKVSLVLDRLSEFGFRSCDERCQGLIAVRVQLIKKLCVRCNDG
jgi:hypothetical protein